MSVSRIRASVRLALLGGAAAMSLAASPVWAQAAPAAPPTGDQPASSSETGDIIVTAQRRSERIEEVPMSMQVISADTLANSGINTIRDLQNVASGFSLNQSGSYPQPAVRGITTSNAGSYESTVALFVDGLYQIAPHVLNMDLPNVNNIQILKGPQGALYGRNATGGAILIETLDPTAELTGSLEGTYGRFNDWRARGYITGPLTDRIGFSLAGTFRKTDGYYKVASVTAPGQFTGRGLGLEQESVRAKIKAELTDNFRVTLGYNFTRADDPRGVFFTPIENVSSAYTGINATRPKNLGELAGDAFILDFKQHEASAKLEFDTGIGTLRSVTGYQYGDLVTTFDSDGTYTPSNISDSNILDKTWQENLDFTIDAIDKVDLILGGTYFHNKERFAEGRGSVDYTAPAGSPAGLPFSSYLKNLERPSQRTKEAWALFIDATFHATDRLSINVGARYSKETQNISAQKHLFCRLTPPCAVVPATVPPTTVPLGSIFQTVYDATNGATYKKFTPRVSIRYEIAPRTNIYASYSQGFKAGEWNGVIPGDNPATWKATGQVGQESINAFEVGLKSGGRRLRFDLSGFYYDYKNLQVSSVQFVSGVASVLLQSIPKARIYGVEGNIDYNVTEDFKIRAGATWLDAKYGDRAIYRGVGVNVAGTGFNSNSDPLKVFPNQFLPPAYQDLTGLQMVRAPDFTGYVGLDYNIPDEEGGIRFSANLKYTTSYAVTDPSIWGGESAASFEARRALDANAIPNNQQLFTAAGAAGTPFLGRAGDQRARQSGFALLNASVTWTHPSGRYYVRAWGNNLTNKIYLVHYRPSSATYKPIGEPRTFGGTVGFRF